MRARLVLITTGLVALLTLALVMAPVDLRQVVSYVVGHPFEMALALLAYTGAFALRALSWRPLIGVRIPLAKLFTLLMGALFLNHAAPAKAGDLARMYALSRRRVPTEKAVVSVALNRLIDLTGLLVVLLVSWTPAGAGEWEKLSLPILVVMSAAIALFLLTRLKIPGFLAARFSVIRPYVSRARVALQETTRTALLESFVFAISAWVLEASILLVVGWGLGLGLSAAEITAATCFAVLVTAVPLTPGALGTYEAGMVAILLSFGVPAELAFAAAVTTHAVKFLYALAAAPFAFREGLAAVRKEKQPDEASVEV